MILAISPFSNFFTFTLQKSDGGSLSTINLENIKQSYLVFEDGENLVKIESLISKSREGLNEGIISYLISQTDARRIRKFKNQKYIITIVEQRVDGVEDESPVYEGSWILYEKKAENVYTVQNQALTEKITAIKVKIDSLNTNITQAQNDNSAIQSETITIRDKNSQLQITLNQKQAELSRLLSSPNPKGSNSILSPVSNNQLA